MYERRMCLAGNLRMPNTKHFKVSLTWIPQEGRKDDRPQKNNEALLKTTWWQFKSSGKIQDKLQPMEICARVLLLDVHSTGETNRLIDWLTGWPTSQPANQLSNEITNLIKLINLRTKQCVTVLTVRLTWRILSVDEGSLSTRMVFI